MILRPAPLAAVLLIVGASLAGGASATASCADGGATVVRIEDWWAPAHLRGALAPDGARCYALDIPLDAGVGFTVTLPEGASLRLLDVDGNELVLTSAPTFSLSVDTPQRPAFFELLGGPAGGNYRLNVGLWSTPDIALTAITVRPEDPVDDGIREVVIDMAVPSYSTVYVDLSVRALHDDGTSRLIDHVDVGFLDPKSTGVATVRWITHGEVGAVRLIASAHLWDRIDPTPEDNVVETRSYVLADVPGTSALDRRVALDASGAHLEAASGAWHYRGNPGGGAVAYADTPWVAALVGTWVTVWLCPDDLFPDAPSEPRACAPFPQSYSWVWVFDPQNGL